ncbi:F-box protein PP2-B11-like [Salvia miltiorrhiza]|uniref:F-box protein PP2-B11-like n=1 Tax=Salvia miltiorrhiza TaxID=226208 RepID=UPI0025AC8559|nr:F-box protein PP2-B11-like [Salvia miltiorrhiza]
MRMDLLSTLPDESLSEILRRTSPADASRFAVISKGFKSAADSDTVWDRFLPADLPEIVSGSASTVVYANKKELYFSLCHSPILIDAGKLSFSLEKKSGKKCYMVGARELGIIWCGDTPWYWDLIPHPDSRFSEVAVLKSVWWLEIRGTIDTRMLSSNTIYGAYLVFKLDDRNARGLESANAFVRFTNDKVDGHDEREAILNHFGHENARDRHGQTGDAPVRIGDGLTEIAAVHLQRANGSEQQSGRVGVRRGDGWMEVELGSFFNDRGDDGAVETWLLGKDGYQGKSGLIVQGIEFRPKP